MKGKVKAGSTEPESDINWADYTEIDLNQILPELYQTGKREFRRALLISWYEEPELSAQKGFRVLTVMANRIYSIKYFGDPERLPGETKILIELCKDEGEKSVAISRVFARPNEGFGEDHKQEHKMQFKPLPQRTWDALNIGTAKELKDLTWMSGRKLGTIKWDLDFTDRAGEDESSDSSSDSLDGAGEISRQFAVRYKDEWLNKDTGLYWVPYILGKRVLLEYLGDKDSLDPGAYYLLDCRLDRATSKDSEGCVVRVRKLEHREFLEIQSRSCFSASPFFDEGEGFLVESGVLAEEGASAGPVVSSEYRVEDMLQDQHEFALAVPSLEQRFQSNLTTDTVARFYEAIAGFAHFRYRRYAEVAFALGRPIQGLSKAEWSNRRFDIAMCPASTKFHGCFAGGLYTHILGVLKIAESWFRVYGVADPGIKLQKEDKLRVIKSACELPDNNVGNYSDKDFVKCLKVKTQGKTPDMVSAGVNLERDFIMLACLLHDCGKIGQYKVSSGRIEKRKVPDHTIMGLRYLTYVDENVEDKFKISPDELLQLRFIINGMHTKSNNTTDVLRVVQLFDRLDSTTSSSLITWG